jgi:transposase
MGFLGLVPSEYSTGDTRRQGDITKTGNGHARRVLVDAAWNCRFPARISHELQIRQEGQSNAVREIAWRAQLRLVRRYRRLNSRKLHPNKICVAHCARARRLYLGHGAPGESDHLNTPGDESPQSWKL